ncbi:type II toxin-antitoxin system VapC family toxin [Nitrospira sp. BLG_1]|uniref:type II toxin-antitoxin system VapC family toxin n=1 Tax=Nitrospira sp. BLG_1 TaxID=3395883 RepID=UPI0039BD3655
MNLLLDTHVFLWFVIQSPRLSKTIYHQIETTPVVYISAASLWEIVIKIQLNKLAADPNELAAKIVDSGFQELPVSVLHTLALERLPLHHRDPFDRILVAQAQVEHLRMLTCDASLKPYGPVCQMLP